MNELNSRRLTTEAQMHIHDSLVAACNKMSIRIKIHKKDLSEESASQQALIGEARRKHPEPTWDEILELLDRCRDEMNQCTIPFRKR
jgi:hypothetical protein